MPNSLSITESIEAKGSEARRGRNGRAAQRHVHLVLGELAAIFRPKYDLIAENGDLAAEETLKAKIHEIENAVLNMEREMAAVKELERKTGCFSWPLSQATKDSRMCSRHASEVLQVIARSGPRSPIPGSAHHP